MTCSWSPQLCDPQHPKHFPPPFHSAQLMMLTWPYRISCRLVPFWTGIMNSRKLPSPGPSDEFNHNFGDLHKPQMVNRLTSDWIALWNWDGGLNERTSPSFSSTQLPQLVTWLGNSDFSVLSRKSGQYSDEVHLHAHKIGLCGPSWWWLFKKHWTTSLATCIRPFKSFRSAEGRVEHGLTDLTGLPVKSSQWKAGFIIIN